MVFRASQPEQTRLWDSLAGAYRVAGEPQRAVVALEHAVADADRALGDEQEVALRFRDNLTAAYQDTGEVRLVIRLHERLLPGRRGRLRLGPLAPRQRWAVHAR